MRRWTLAPRRDTNPERGQPMTQRLARNDFPWRSVQPRKLRQELRERRGRQKTTATKGTYQRRKTAENLQQTDRCLSESREVVDDFRTARRWRRELQHTVPKNAFQPKVDL